MLLSELAKQLGCALEGAGDIDVDIRRVSGLEDAEPGDLSFFSNRKYARHVATTRASAMIADKAVTAAPCPIIRSAHPYVTLAQAIAILAPEVLPEPGISKHAIVHPTAVIGADVSIGAFTTIDAGVVIGARTVVLSHVSIGSNAVIGEDCQIRAHVSVRYGAEIGNRVIVQDGAVIGSEGFGFATRPDGTHLKIPQTGRVIIADDVEIGANCTVDRPAVGATRIGEGTKIDNLGQIAHGVKIGKRVLIAAQVGIAGSSVLEDDVIFAGQVGVVGHIHIGRGVIVTSKAGVTHDIEPGARIAGFPAFDLGEWKKASVLFRQSGRKRAAEPPVEVALTPTEPPRSSRTPAKKQRARAVPKKKLRRAKR